MAAVETGIQWAITDWKYVVLEWQNPGKQNGFMGQDRLGLNSNHFLLFS